MFYFTCNESKIYESFTFWNNLQEKLFHDILIHWDAPVYIYIYIYICQRVTTVAAVSTNDTHQIPIPWFLFTVTCQPSSTALYPCTPPVHSLSGLKHSMLTYPLSTYQLLQCSYLHCSTVSTLRCSLWIPRKRTLPLRLALETFPFPRLLTWTFCSSQSPLLLLNKPVVCIALTCVCVCVCVRPWSTKLVISRYICSNSQQYIVWVKIIDFSFMPKIITILS